MGLKKGRALDQAGFFEGGVGSLFGNRFQGSGGEAEADMPAKFGNVELLTPQVRTEFPGGVGGDVHTDTA